MIVKILRPGDPFARIPNRVLRDPKLSFRAIGVMAYLLSRPEDWVVKLDELYNRKQEGRDAIRSVFKELREAGYAKLEPLAGGGSQWIIHCYPQDFRPPEKGHLGAPENPSVRAPEKPDALKIRSLTNKREEVQTKDNTNDLLLESVQTIKNGAQIPAELDNSQFRDLWKEYADYRKENKKQFGEFGPIAQKRLLNTLNQRPAQAVAGLNWAMDRQYRGFEWRWYDKEQQTIRQAQPKKRLNDDL